MLMADLTLDDVATAAPGLLTLLVNSMRSAQREYLYQRVLYGSINRTDGTAVLSAAKVQRLKDDVDKPFDELAADLRLGISKSAARHFASVLSACLGLQVGNMRLARVITDIRELPENASIKDVEKVLSDAEERWERGD